MWPIEAHEVLEIIHEEGDEEYVPLEKKSKQRKQSWTEKNMSDALNCCKNQELGIEEASVIYGIPKRSLRSRLKDKNFSVIDDKYKVFVLPVVPPEAELKLVEHLQDLIKSQFKLTSVEVRRIAYELLSEKYQINNLPQEKDCLVGNRWYKKFIAKYPHLKMENADGDASHDKSETFYNTLECLIAENQIGPERIFCVEGVELKFRASDSYDFDNIYHRRKVIYTDAKAICCISASGMFLPPEFIQPEEKRSSSASSHSEDENYPRDESCGLLKSNNRLGTAYDELKVLCERETGLLPTAEEVANIKSEIKAYLKRKVQPVTEENEEELREKLYEQFSKLRNKIIAKYEDSLNSISSEMFHEWLKNSFIPRIKPSFQRKVILLAGDQSHVKCLKTLQLAKANGVVFLVLPPHSVHKIHPLDGFAMSLNRNLSTCASIWLGKNPNFKIHEVPLHDLFHKAYTTTVNPNIAKNGFIYSGIWPVNRNIFESTELGGESVLLKCGFQPANAAESPTSSRTNLEIAVSANELTAIDLSKLCRVCMKEKIYMKPIFESGETNYYGKKLSEIVKKKISPEDGIPLHICQYCLVQLKDVVKIRSLAIESNEKLLMLKQALGGCFYEKHSSEHVSLHQFQLRKLTDSKLFEKLLTKECDIHSICRICMTEKPLLTSIFRASKASSNFSPDFSNKIVTVSDCQVHVEDELSSSICPFCRTSINQAWEFFEKAISSDRRFREILGLNPDEPP